MTPICVVQDSNMAAVPMRDLSGNGTQHPECCLQF